MSRSRSLVLLLSLPVLACAHAAAPATPEVIVREVSADSAQLPILACTESVLAGSSLVERFNNNNEGWSLTRRTWYVVLRNPPGPRAQSLEFAVRPSHGTPRELVVSFPWPGMSSGEGGMKPPSSRATYDTEGEMLRDASLVLLDAVRTECAPKAPGQPVCSRIAQGHESRCSLGL